MSFFRNVAEAIVRSAGYPVPMNSKQWAGAQESGFNQLLAGIANRGNSVQVPAPPTPPTDPNDPEAQKDYNEALLQYNQQFQTYHTRILQMFSQRFLMMQQALIQARSQQSSSMGDPRFFRPGGIGVGGILSGDNS